MSDINNSNGNMKLRDWWRIVVSSINALSTRIDTIISGSSPDKDAELTDIRTVNSSYTPLNPISVAGDVTRDMQQQFVDLKNSKLSKSTYLVISTSVMDDYLQAVNIGYTPHSLMITGHLPGFETSTWGGCGSSDTITLSQTSYNQMSGGYRMITLDAIAFGDSNFDYYKGTITEFTSYGFIIRWEKVGNPTVTGNFEMSILSWN